MSENPHRTNTVKSVGCAIVIVSDTRTPQTDQSGPWLRERLESAGHTVVSYDILPDDPAAVCERVLASCDMEACQAVLLSGGTGLTSRDTTYEAITSLFDKRLDGFGELFRMLSYQQVGSAAMLSRAVAGVVRRTFVVSMPGSPAAVSLAVDKLILPNLGHVVWLLSR